MARTNIRAFKVSGHSDALLKARTFAEFFAGIGLMRLGLEHEGWKIRFANDISEDKRAMYDAQFADTQEHFLLEDIHTLAANSVPDVTLATASFPCTDLSLAGMRKGLKGKESSAYWGFICVLEEMEERRPPLVLLENVAGFLTSHGGKDFTEALLALNKLGYEVDALILDAARFVPQSRVRLFVVGVLPPEHSVSMVRETAAFYESSVRPRALADFVFQHPEIKWRIQDIPEPPTCSKRVEDLLEELPSDATEWWNKKRTDYLVGQMSKRHLESLTAMRREKRWSYGTVFRRVRTGKSMAELRTDGIAGCLRTPRGGSARQIVIKAGYGSVSARLLTPRECARLMGADDFTIEANLNKALFGFGDAVCVPVVSWLAHNYLNPLIKQLELEPKTHGSKLYATR